MAQVTSLHYAVAREFIRRYEWVGNMGTSKHCYGLWLKNELAGVVCFGPPVAPSLYCRLLGRGGRGVLLQLCRGASTHWAPKWVPSRLIAQALRLVDRDLGAKVVVAYADPRAGEIGTIYQACNAYYLGMTRPGGARRYVILGQAYDARKVGKVFGSRARAVLRRVDPSYRTERVNCKHRYLFVLGGRRERLGVLRRIARKVRPYPKRGVIRAVS